MHHPYSYYYALSGPPHIKLYAARWRSTGKNRAPTRPVGHCFIKRYTGWRHSNTATKKPYTVRWYPVRSIKSGLGPRQGIRGIGTSDYPQAFEKSGNVKQYTSRRLSTCDHTSIQAFRPIIIFWISSCKQSINLASFDNGTNINHKTPLPISGITIKINFMPITS